VLEDATLDFAILHAKGAVRDMRPRKVPKKPFLYWASQRINPDDAALQLIDRTPGLQNLMGGKIFTATTHDTLRTTHYSQPLLKTHYSLGWDEQS